VQLAVPPTRWDYELLSLGRQIPLAAGTKAVLGRNETDNQALTRHFAREDRPDGVALLEPDNVPGPTAIVISPRTQSPSDDAVPDSLLQRVAQHMAQRTKQLPPAGLRLRVTQPDQAPSLLLCAQPFPCAP